MATSVVPLNAASSSSSAQTLEQKAGQSDDGVTGALQEGLFAEHEAGFVHTSHHGGVLEPPDDQQGTGSLASEEAQASLTAGSQQAISTINTSDEAGNSHPRQQPSANNHISAQGPVPASATTDQPQSANSSPQMQSLHAMKVRPQEPYVATQAIEQQVIANGDGGSAAPADMIMIPPASLGAAGWSGSLAMRQHNQSQPQLMQHQDPMQYHSLASETDAGQVPQHGHSQHTSHSMGMHQQVPIHLDMLNHLPGTQSMQAVTRPHPTANSTSSLDSYASNHSSNIHAGRGGGNQSGKGVWMNANVAQGGPGGMARDKRGSRGSYNNLQAAGAGGGKGYQGRNGTYATTTNRMGMSGNSSRASMDDLLANQQQHGMGNRGGYYRGMPQEPGHQHGYQQHHQQQYSSYPASEQGALPGLDSLPEPSGTTDLERFMMQITPMINVDCTTQPAAEALLSLSLGDVWRFYLEPSLYGREVYTLGGARGPSLSYFVPYLSAMQLFTPAQPPEGSGSNSSKSSGSQGKLYLSDTDGWPKHMQLQYELFESELPFNRYPMYEELERLAVSKPLLGKTTAAQTSQPSTVSSLQQSDGRRVSQSSQGAGQETTTSTGQQQPAATQQPPSQPPSKTDSATQPVVSPEPAANASIPTHPTASTVSGPANSWLHNTRLCELHPASWYCVAWYPVYRIPDAPLNTRFLTFHSFAPLVFSIQNALDALSRGQQCPLSVLPVGVVGLKWNNMHGERWLEPLAVDGPTGVVSSLLGREEETPTAGGFAGRGRRGPPPATRGMDSHFQAHLSELQATAERLARGYGVRIQGPHGIEDCKQKHPDFEFFNSRA